MDTITHSTIKKMSPQFLVTDIDRSIEFYIKKMGTLFILKQARLPLRKEKTGEKIRTWTLSSLLMLLKIYIKSFPTNL